LWDDIPRLYTESHCFTDLCAGYCVVFLSNFLSVKNTTNPHHHPPQQTECFECSRDITKRPTGRLLRLIVESLLRFIPTLERDKENYSGKLNCVRSHTTANQPVFSYTLYIIICSSYLPLPSFSPLPSATSLFRGLQLRSISN